MAAYLSHFVGPLNSILETPTREKETKLQALASLGDLGLATG